MILAAKLAGVDEIYRIGGAQAIAALAYGTESIPPVDKITGPGNAFVAAAKRRVFGKVGIDMIAGPSEILVIADADNDPDWLALDMLSQAEHDESAQAILITDSPVMAKAVQVAIERHLQTLERREIAAASWRDNGAVIHVPDLATAARLSNRVAPEHLELCVANPMALADDITHAGGNFPWCVDTRSHWRLRRRAEPCAAHRTLGTVFFGGAIGAGLPQTDNAGANDARGAACHWPGGRDAGQFGKP